MMDADLATDLTEVDHFLSRKDEAPIFVGSRRSRLAKRSWTRKILGKIARWLIHVVLHLRVADPQCGFKLFHRQALSLFSQLQINRRGFDFELLYQNFSSKYQKEMANKLFKKT